MEKKISSFWMRRRRSTVFIDLIEYSNASAFWFPQGFMATFATIYRESLVARAEISVLKTLVNNLHDAGAREDLIRILKGLIHKLYKSNTANATEAAVLEDLIAQAVVPPHHIPLVQGIITGHSVAGVVPLDEDEALAHIIMKKLQKAYTTEEELGDFNLRILFDPSFEPASLDRCSCSQQ